MSVNHVNLRALRWNDKELLYEWITDRDLHILNAAYYPVSEADHEQWFESMMYKRTDLVIFAIEECESGDTIGTCQLFNLNGKHRSAELQIRIGSDKYQGHGFGSEAIMLLTKFGFKDLNLHRIYLNVFSSNVRAINSYKKCGFKQEGQLKEAAFVDGKWVDILIMSLLK